MTKELFLKYEEVRRSGAFNMITEADEAMHVMKLNARHRKDRDLYWDIVQNYSTYSRQWLLK